MDSINKYQELCQKTAVFPEVIELEYLTLGLVGEAGEIANKVKKVLRGDYPEDAIREQIVDELGDVLWYVAMLARHFGVDMSDVAGRNLDKLQARLVNGTIRGTGDQR